MINQVMMIVFQYHLSLSGSHEDNMNTITGSYSRDPALICLSALVYAVKEGN